MWRGTLRALGVGSACLALACATAGTGGEEPRTLAAAAAESASAAEADVVSAKVTADGKVDQEEIHLSVARKQRVQWDVEGDVALQVVPDEGDDVWPLDVRCAGNHCEGTLRRSPKLGRHSYHLQVGAAAGADPVIIIDG